ncbi:putative dehydrogenase [Microbacterium trichothecenolyticum]|uniref:Gfo/Idh/MocA family protein n=1 Tax=Microbacterium trichothecenolyticum TaxID=69370 RepID=UPI0028543617|nr:Gfo/Idh/MocA family oxidoreductase [Microbacterium trichothecenolyticum]MDR7184580.1 putative dehydrogenase [Microbacterium trichothecenolyticum]
MTDTVNIAIVGGGLMGREIAAAIQRWPALVDHPVRPRLRAVCDINPDALEWFRQIDGVTLLTTDADEVFADPSIDVVYIAVRHDLHEDLYTRAVRAGKDLLAEKPFGIDAGAAERVIAAAAETGAFVRVSSEMPFFPGAQTVVDYVRSGAAGRIVAVRSGFLHSSDLDPDKPINWKRQARFCGEAGVMNDLGMHAWHVPLRLGLAPQRLTAQLVDLVPDRPGPGGERVPVDTWENAAIHADVAQGDGQHPLEVRVERVSPGNKNTWYLEVIGMDGGARFSTASPKQVEVFAMVDVAGSGPEQSWQRIEVGSQSVWPTVTGGIFESGFSDAILQMWAAFLAERAGALGDRFGCARPEEALAAHRLADAAIRSHRDGIRVTPADDHT